MGYCASFSWLIRRLGQKRERGNREGRQKVKEHLSERCSLRSEKSEVLMVNDPGTEG